MKISKKLPKILKRRVNQSPLYINDDVGGLRDLYGAFCEMETKSPSNDREGVHRTVLNYMDWFSQVTDETIKLGRNDIEFSNFGHSRRLTGPVCDFFRQMTGYEPDF